MSRRPFHPVGYFMIFLVLASAGRARPAQQPADPERGQVAPEDRVVISVGEEKITAARLEKIIRALPPQYREYYGGAGKRELPQYLVKLKVLAAEARKRNLQTDAEVRQAIETARESILADAAERKIQESLPVSDQELEELYQNHKSEFEEVRIRAIILRTDNAALSLPAAPNRPPLPVAEARKKLEELRKRALAGADFAELAQENSDDLATAGAGGDVGYVNRQTVIPPVSNAAYALSPGQISDVISTPYGLEVIKLEAKRTKSLKDVAPTLLNQIRQDKFARVYEQLLIEYTPVVDSQYFNSQSNLKATPSSSSPK